jgi:transcriptional regulator with XRE-family HTH domain
MPKTENASPEVQALIDQMDQFVTKMRKTIGLNVRRFRQAKGITQEELAHNSGGRRFGISVRTIARVEAGAPVAHERLETLAATLDVDIEDLKMQIEMPTPELDFIHWRGF